MDATTTHSMPLLIQKLKAAHPDLSFIEADQFSWSPNNRTVYYTLDTPNAEALLLHELSHALLGHRSYERDVELVSMETAAWEKASDYLKANAIHFAGIPLNLSEAVIQDHLDTYRDWLHARSTCPNCSANGYQTDVLKYTCPACSHSWKVNEARLCALRRYSL